jgi:hypothetical protein
MMDFWYEFLDRFETFRRFGFLLYVKSTCRVRSLYGRLQRNNPIEKPFYTTCKQLFDVSKNECEEEGQGRFKTFFSF